MVEEEWFEKGSEQLVPKRFTTLTRKEAVDPGTPPFNWLDGIAVLRRLISRKNLDINHKLAFDHFLKEGKDLNLNLSIQEEIPQINIKSLLLICFAKPT